MSAGDNSPETEHIMLRGPKVQYSNGRIVTPRPFDLEEVLTDYVRLSDDVCKQFLSILAHSFTVDIRVALYDRPIPDADAERAHRLNEWLHQLTTCLNPRGGRSVVGEADLIRSIAIEGLQYGLGNSVGRGVATAARNVIVRSKKHSAAVD